MVSNWSKSKTPLEFNHRKAQILTCDEIGTLGIEVKLLHEEDLSQGDEREDGHVVGQADKTEEPEGQGKREDVTKSDL